MPPGRVGFVLRGKGVRLIRGLGFKSPFPWAAFYTLDDFYLEHGSAGAVLQRPVRKGAGEPVYLDYASIKEVTVADTKVLVDGRLVLEAPSAKVAEHLKRQLEKMKELAEKKRLEAARKLIAEQIDPQKAKDVRAADDKVLVTLRFFASCVLLMVVGVIGYLLSGRTERLPQLALAWGTLTLIGMMKFISAHAKLWPRDRAQRWTRVFTYLYPFGLAKSPDVCSHDRMADLHILAPMRAYAGAADQGRMIETMLGDARNAPAGDDSPLQRARVEHRANLVSVLEGIVTSGPSKKTANNDDGVVVRCPRCGAGYTRRVAECFDCGAAIEEAS
jgi:hypothetical protein